MNFRTRLDQLITVGFVMIGITISANAQDTAYAFSTKCFAPPTVEAPTAIGGAANIRITLKSDAPKECSKIENNGLVLTEQALTVTYTKAYLDAKVAAITTDVNDLSKKAIDAIKTSVADNSVQAGQIDALVDSIESKLYAKLLARVKADLAAAAQSPSAPKKVAGKQ